MGSTDRVNEHLFMQEGESTAFEGQASDTKWLARVRTELDQDIEGQETIPSNYKSAIPLSATATAAKRLQMNTEDADMSVVGNQIYPLEMPIRATADDLVEAYFTTVHPSFPVLDQTEFMAKYEDVIRAPDLALYRDRTFIASLQLVFGIGAVHAHLVNAEWAGDERDHVLYIASARMLAVDSGLLNDLCYLDQVRVFALGAFYLLATDQINRYEQYFPYCCITDTLQILEPHGTRDKSFSSDGTAPSQRYSFADGSRKGSTCPRLVCHHLAGKHAHSHDRSPVHDPCT